MKENSMSKFNPALRQFEISGKRYRLKKFSIAAQVWITSEFSTEGKYDGFDLFVQGLTNNNAAMISKACYFLLEDKSDFPTWESFTDAMKDTYSILSILLPPLSQSIEDSRPDIDEDDAELKKS